ncbi:MAG: cytidylate kinase-like family protein [Deltaproteobacteria bacterium]|nr:cytidylate kinase-like family protein [Deltaproteobacteria bacterium]
MGIITVARGSYSYGQEIAERVAQHLGWRCISREVILATSEEYDIPEIKLTRAFENAPSMLNPFNQGKRRYIAYTRSILLDHLNEGNVVYHGFAGQFFIQGISHALKILITANMEKRISLVMKRDNISRKGAAALINKLDDQRKRWGKTLYGIEPWDPRLYDLVFNIDRITVEDTVDIICETSKRKQFQMTPKSEKAMDDLLLTVKVENFLLDVKPDVNVHIDNKFVYLKPAVPLREDSELVERMGDIIKTFPNIRGIEVVS